MDVAPVKLKTCSKCTQSKPLADFRAFKTSTGRSLRAKCRECECAEDQTRRNDPSARPTSPTPEALGWEPAPRQSIPVAVARPMPPAPHAEPVTAGLVRILFVPDTHAPYEDATAWAVMLAAAKVIQPEIIVILGDFADFYSVSSHSKNPTRASDLKYEVERVKERLAELDALGARRKIYVAGNHEDRLSRYLCDQAPALFGSVTIPEVLGLAERGWEYHPYKEHVKLGKLKIVHDVGTAGRNANRQAMDVFQGSTIIGHTHRLEYSVIGAADGPPSVGAMFGWLGRFEDIDYMNQAKARRDWVHGFGYGVLENPSGIVHVTPVPIVNGSCCVLGQVIRVAS